MYFSIVDMNDNVHFAFVICSPCFHEQHYDYWE